MKKCLHKKKTKNRRAKPLPPTTNKKPSEHQLPGGVGYLDALVQFAGEVIRLNAMLDQIEVARLEENRERYGAA